MKKIFYKPWQLICSIGLLLSGGYYGYSCADDWWDYSMYSTFAPESSVDSSYRALFYAPYDKFYGYSPMDNASLFNKDIVQQWSDYLKGDMPKQDIEKLLLFTPSDTETFASYFARLKNENKTTWNLNSKKVANFFDFLAIAKKVDLYSNDRTDYWDYESHVASSMQMDLANEVKNYYLEKVKDSKLDNFYKNRIWFQAIKALFYSDERFAVVDFFDTTQEFQPKNTLYYRALAYKAGAYYQKEDYQNSDIVFAKVFNDSPELRQLALYNYKPLSSLQTTQMLERVKQKPVQAAILAMDAYYSPESTFAAMQRIYKIDSKSEHLDLLLSRWINIQEEKMDNLKSVEYKSEQEYLLAMENAIDHKTLKWIVKTAKQPLALHNPAMWYMAAGYVDIYTKQYKEAKENFTKAKTYVNDNALLLDQIRIFEVINDVSQIQQLNNDVDPALIQQVNWLLNELDYHSSSSEKGLRYTAAQHWVRQHISQIYKTQNNLVLQEIASPDLSFYANVDNTRAMEEYFLQENKSDWEEVLLKDYQITLSDIYENQAILLFYQNQLQEALQVLKKAKKHNTKDYFNQEYIAQHKDYELQGNPFNGKIKDCNDCDHQALQKVKYTKETFLEKLIEMQGNIDRNIDVFNNALLMANAFYNTTYYGNARMFYDSKLFAENSNYIKPKHRAYLLNMSRAREYYFLALQHATDDEQSAKISYMLAKLERNEFYQTTYQKFDYMYSAWNDDIAFKPWQGFKDLQEKYQDTNYYKQVINECGYFKTYVDGLAK